MAKTKKKYKEKDWLFALDITSNCLEDFCKKTDNLKVLKDKKLKKAQEEAIEAMYNLYCLIGKEGI